MVWNFPQNHLTGFYAHRSWSNSQTTSLAGPSTPQFNLILKPLYRLVEILRGWKFVGFTNSRVYININVYISPCLKVKYRLFFTYWKHLHKAERFTLLAFLNIRRSPVSPYWVCTVWWPAGLFEEESGTKRHVLQGPWYQATNHSICGSVDEICLASRWWNVLLVFKKGLIVCFCFVILLLWRWTWSSQ